MPGLLDATQPIEWNERSGDQNFYSEAIEQNTIFMKNPMNYIDNISSKRSQFRKIRHEEVCVPDERNRTEIVCYVAMWCDEICFSNALDT